MRLAPVVLLFTASLWSSACSDSTAPRSPAPPTPQLGSSVLEPLGWAPVQGTRGFRYRLDDGAPVSFAGSDVGFWAVKGEARTLSIDYQNPGEDWKPYVTFSLEPSSLAERPDGSSFAAGDSVLITVSLDAASLVLHFAPTGLTFTSEAPADLQWWYTGANQDLNGDGAVNFRDALLEPALVLRVQSLPTDPWELLGAVQSLTSHRFDARLRHFSGYAVSW